MCGRAIADAHALTPKIMARDASRQVELTTEAAALSAGVPDAARFTAPLAVLVDEGTASASEILAAALQDAGRATVVGRQTYGKGRIQGVLPLSGGGALFLTEARYVSPVRCARACVRARMCLRVRVCVSARSRTLARVQGAPHRRRGHRARRVLRRQPAAGGGAQRRGRG